MLIIVSCNSSVYLSDISIRRWRVGMEYLLLLAYPISLSPPICTDLNTLAPPPFTLTSPKLPTNLMTGAVLWISHATANWMTTCPISTQRSSNSMWKRMLCTLPKLYAKGNWSWHTPPNNWPTWSAWHRHSLDKGMSNLLCGEAGGSQHMGVLARAGGDETGLR